MTNIYYSFSDFRKAVKRNKVKIAFITCNDFTDEFWFHTQKAVISYAASTKVHREIMEQWIKDQGVKISYVY